MEIFTPNEKILDILHFAQERLLTSEKLKFQKSKEWRSSKIPNSPGIYALYETGNKLLYIGESGNLCERMNEINRTVNHSFRKQFGHLRFGGIKSKKKFDLEVEEKLDLFFEGELYVSFIEVYFGRLEIEEFLIFNHQRFLTNSIKSRKLKNIIEFLNKVR